jgi:carbamoylphosphate synthase large subunit
LGTPVKTIEDTEDRELFRQSMLKANVSIAKSKSASTLSDAIKVGKEIGYPVIIRVAYTLAEKAQA